MEDKQFDAVRMVREIRDRHEQELAGKTNEERLAYYRQKAAEMHARLSERAAQRASRPE